MEPWEQQELFFLYIKPSLGRNVQNVSKLTFVICIVRCKCVLEKSISMNFTTKTDHNDMHILIILYTCITARWSSQSIWKVTV